MALYKYEPTRKVSGLVGKPAREAVLTEGKAQTDLVSDQDISLPIAQTTSIPQIPSEGVNVAINLLQSWLDNDEHVEHDEEWEHLKQELDKDRLSHRQFFP